MRAEDLEKLSFEEQTTLAIEISKRESHENGFSHTADNPGADQDKLDAQSEVDQYEYDEIKKLHDIAEAKGKFTKEEVRTIISRVFKFKSATPQFDLLAKLEEIMKGINNDSLLLTEDNLRNEHLKNFDKYDVEKLSILERLTKVIRHRRSSTAAQFFIDQIIEQLLSAYNRVGPSSPQSSQLRDFSDFSSEDESYNSSEPSDMESSDADQTQSDEDEFSDPSIHVSSAGEKQASKADGRKSSLSAATTSQAPSHSHDHNVQQPVVPAAYYEDSRIKLLEDEIKSYKDLIAMLGNNNPDAVANVSEEILKRELRINRIKEIIQEKRTINTINKDILSVDAENVADAVDIESILDSRPSDEETKAKAEFAEIKAIQKKPQGPEKPSKSSSKSSGVLTFRRKAPSYQQSPDPLELQLQEEVAEVMAAATSYPKKPTAPAP